MNDLYEPEVCLDGPGPLHRQLCEQIRAHILLGGLRPGDQLPTVRAAAVELAVNPQAVERAYRELERQGLLTTEDGSGVFVAGPRCQWDLAAACADLLERARRAGYPAAAVLEMTRRVAGGENQA
jgi:DNA-binding transcriptional regulator YhcF (GntR family)